VKRNSTVEFAGDRGYGRRLALAFALAVALHEMLAGLLPRHEPAPPEERVVARNVTIAHRPKPTPKPTPPPTPQPTPHVTPAPHYTLAPTIAVRAPAPRAAAVPRRTVGGAAARRRILQRTVVARVAPPQSLAEGTHAGVQNGGTGTGAGPGSGAGGLAGSGTGTGGSGNGNGGDTDSAPCGAVYLVPEAVTSGPDGSVMQQVQAKIVLRDGTVEKGDFPYPFTYAAERLNPFIHADALAPDRGTPVQLPPRGVDVSSAPVAVQIVLKYTDPATGTTTLKDCPSASPAPQST